MLFNATLHQGRIGCCLLFGVVILCFVYKDLIAIGESHCLVRDRGTKMVKSFPKELFPRHSRKPSTLMACSGRFMDRSSMSIGR